MKKPFFSIVMPVYNTEKYVRESIESILRQDFTDWELIIVDDGSSDDAGKIADDYKSEKIRIIHNDNNGTLIARQTAIRKARGKYLLFIDSDDYYLKGALKHIYSVLKSNNCECDMLIFDYVRVSSFREDDMIIEIDDTQIFKNKVDILKTILYDSSMNNLWRKAIKVSCFDKSKEYSKHRHVVMGEDLLMTLDVLEKVDLLVLDKSKMYGYRVHRDSTVAMDLERPIVLDYSIREKAYRMLMKHIRPFSDYEKQYIKQCRKIFVINTVNKIAFQKSGLDIYEKIKSMPYYKKVLDRKKVFGAAGIRYTVLFEAFRHDLYFVIGVYGAFLRWRRRQR